MTYKSNDTCWAAGSECGVMGRDVRKHATNIPPTPAGECPGRWAGEYQANKSGGVLNPYLCQQWSYVTRTDGTPVFDIH